MRPLMFLALVRVLAPGGCGGPDPEDASPRSAYGLSLRTSGALVAAIDRDDRFPAISSERSHGPGFAGAFVPDDASPLRRVELAIDALPEGATGADFPARLRLLAGARAYEGTDCRARVERQTLQTPTGDVRPTGRSYVVAGTLSCAQPLRDPNEAGEGLVVERFEFALPVAWDLPRDDAAP